MPRKSLYSVWIGIVLSLLFSLGSSEPALATHEADHRFTISGYVRDDAGNPLSGITVLLEHKGGVKKETRSDPRGYYEVMFHLHNDNIGDEILVQVGDLVRRVAVQFDPDDRFTDRRSEPVDFGAPGRSDASDLIYWGSGIGLLLSTVVYLRFFKKKKTRPKRKKKEKIHKKR